MRGLVRYCVHRPVPVNLLMTAVILAGLFAAVSLRRQFFPETNPEAATISLVYPGASPEEIEETLAIKVEDALRDLQEEVDEFSTTLAEGGGGIVVQFHEGVDPDAALDELEREIDRLQDLPDEAEEITTQLLEPRLSVIRVAVFGDLDDAVMKEAIRDVRDDLRSLPDMGEVLVTGARDYELRVDVREDEVLRYGLSLPVISERIGAAMRDIPGGTVRGDTGNVKVRTMGVRERASAIRQIELLSDEQGRAVRVSDVAEVHETFEDSDIVTRFQGQPSAFLTIFKVGDQDIVQIAEMVRSYVAGQRGEAFEPTWIDRLALAAPPRMREMMPTHRIEAFKLGQSGTPLPAGAQIAAHSDLARYVEGRLDLLTRNALYGALLVFGSLLLFLNWRVALWVGVGLSTAMLGTLALMSGFDITLNLLTMFGLIVVLGLLVDDAIVVSENIQRRHDQGEAALHAAEHGTVQVFWPVVATVMTSIVAFLPLTFIRGNIGDLLGALPVVVACALAMSLIESLMILPSHMGHSLMKRDRARPGRFAQRLRDFEKWRDGLILDQFVPWFGRLLERLLRRRYTTIAVALAVLITTLGMLAGRHVGFVFLPASDSETVVVDLRLPVGATVERTNRVVAKVEAAAKRQPEFQSVSTLIGTGVNIDTGQQATAAPHTAQMFIELKPTEQRDRESGQVIQSMREALAGRIDEVERISFSEISGGPGGRDIVIEVRGDRPADLEAAAADLKQMLADYKGVFDIADDNDEGQLELQYELLPSGRALGFTEAGVAQQVRGALFGLDAHTFAEREEDIDVRVRLDEPTRRSLHAIENLWLISPAGNPVPVQEIVRIDEASAYATIKRINKRRAVTVTADVAPGISPEDITRDLTNTEDERVSPLDQVRSRHPAVEIVFGGRQEQMADAFGSLPYGFLAAVVMIYIILAILFSRYFQPLVVLLVVPFAVVGVVWGHFILRYEMTFLSLIGFVALTGIVVNDSLILVQFYNEQLREGHGVFESLIRAGKARVRAIFLTTITTVLGLLPLILEQSFQAKFLIPMAISIAGGLIAATGIVLIVLPCFIMVFDDIRSLSHFLWHGRRREAESHAAPSAVA